MPSVKKWAHLFHVFKKAFSCLWQFAKVLLPFAFYFDLCHIFPTLSPFILLTCTFFLADYILVLLILISPESFLSGLVVGTIPSLANLVHLADLLDFWRLNSLICKRRGWERVTYKVVVKVKWKDNCRSFWSADKLCQACAVLQSRGPSGALWKHLCATYSYWEGLGSLSSSPLSIYRWGNRSGRVKKCAKALS